MKKVFLLLVFSLFTAVAFGQAMQQSNLMPLPQNISFGDGRFVLNANFNVGIMAEPTDTTLYFAVNRAYQALNRKTRLYFGQQYITTKNYSDTATLFITVKQKAVAGMGADEEYSLTISAKQIRLTANNTLGALHGLQTLLQLLTHDGNGYYFPAVTINDAPRFKWRGLMIDVARHFIPLDVIKRNIDAMEAVKMNVLHLHVSDDEGFRIESKIYPGLQQLGSNGDYYSQEQIKDLIRYAALRGITIVPEFDLPGHATSWFAGYPELASAPGPYTTGPRFKMSQPDGKPLGLMDIMKMINTYPTPSFDPTKESTYVFLDKFLGEMAALFPSPYIHIGADENNGAAWKANPAIVNFMKQKNIANTHDLQAYFVKRISEIVAKHYKKTIGWEELFSKDLPKNVTVQVWSDGAYRDKALANGNTVLLSKGFYLDVFMPAYIHYNNVNLPDSVNTKKNPQFLGGEAAQWAEAVNQDNVETRIWPRAAAVAERLWSAASVKDVDDMYRRLFITSHELDEMGVQHVADYERSLRRLTGGEDISALKTLTDVLTPVKGYKKLFARMTKAPGLSYQTAPLVALSDIVFVDSETKRKFRCAVKSYLANRDTASEKIVRTQLKIWKSNTLLLQPTINKYSLGAELNAHSEHLTAAAVIGLSALDMMKAGTLPDASWVTKTLTELSTINITYGDLDLTILPEIMALVKQKLDSEPADFPIF